MCNAQHTFTIRIQYGFYYTQFVFQLHDSLPVENRESNALPALRHMTLAKDERAVLADEVRKHASEDTAVKAWSIENKPKTKSE
jgi:hypothetical protein